MVKKGLVALLVACVLSITSCGGSSNVVDYTGKTDDQEKAGAVEEPADKSIEETAEKPAETSESEQGKEDVKDSKEPSYDVRVASFDITKNEYLDEYVYNGIVEVENTGDVNIYLSGVAFDLEDSEGSLVLNDDMINVCPDVIKPGETGYLYNLFGTSLEGVEDVEDLQLVPQYIVKTTDTTPHEYEVSDVSLRDDTFGVTLTARMTNDTDQDVSYLYVTVAYYDSDGEIIALSGTSVTDFLAGRKVSFEISGINLPEDLTTDDIDDYKIFAREDFYAW